jgi:hypothetical protein
LGTGPVPAPWLKKRASLAISHTIPSLHAVQVVDPTSKKKPAGQTQSAGLSEPLTCDLLPATTASQGKQEVDPALGWYSMASQSWHWVVPTPLENLPAGHFPHTVWPPLPVNMPGPHSMHEETLEVRVWSPYVPGGQSTGASMPGGQNWPLGQGKGAPSGQKKPAVHGGQDSPAFCVQSSPRTTMHDIAAALRVLQAIASSVKFIL